VIASARTSAAVRPTCTASVAKNEVKALQRALSWELRAATILARLLRDQRRCRLVAVTLLVACVSCAPVLTNWAFEGLLAALPARPVDASRKLSSAFTVADSLRNISSPLMRSIILLVPVRCQTR
jgi:hypothetical protein